MSYCVKTKPLRCLLTRKYTTVAVSHKTVSLSAAVLLLPSLGCLCEGFWENHFEGKASANENSKSFPLVPLLKMHETLLLLSRV